MANPSLLLQLLLASCGLALMTSCGEPSLNAEAPVTFDVSDFGAVGDSVTLNTTAIQAAIDSCSRSGGGVVLLADGNYLSGTILLKDDVTLHLQADAKISGSGDPRDYQSIDAFTDATGQLRGNCLVGGVDVKNISITGEGTIDGNGAAFEREPLQTLFAAREFTQEEITAYGGNRPFLLRFVRSANINLKGITLRQSAAWACHFYQSSAIEVEGIQIYNHAHRNNDGIDLDSSHDIVIKDCDIDAGDDAICFKTTSPLPTYNARVSGCKLSSEWGAIKFGTESMGDMYDIQIEDCDIVDNLGGGIKILSVDGANIHNVTIRNIRMNRVDMPLFIRLGERRRTYRGADQQPVGSIDNIRISKLVATTRDTASARVKPAAGIFITGTPTHKVGQVFLEGISITLFGDTLAVAPDEVAEMTDKYPEYVPFGPLPAYGLYARHITGLDTVALRFKLEGESKREAVIYDDALSSSAPNKD